MSRGSPPQPAKRTLPAVLASLLLLSPALFVPPPGSPRDGGYVLQDDRYIYAGNEHLEFVFRKADGHLHAVLDRVTGVDFIEEKDAWWNGYAIWYPADGELQSVGGWLPNRFAYTSSATPTGMTLALTWGQFRLAGNILDLTVTVTVEMPNDSPLVYWRVDISNNEALTIEAVDLPTLSGIGQISSDPSSDYLAYPTLSGILFQDPLHNFRIGRGHGWELYYPSGFANMQFAAYYSTENRAGLYLASQDTAGYTKFLNVGRPDEDWMSFAIRHVPQFQAGADYRLPYSVIVGVFHGDWFDAAQLYRSWARQQWWTDQGQISQRRDIPDWYKHTAVMGYVFTRYWTRDRWNGPFSSLPRVAKAMKRRFDASPILVWTGWENKGSWVEPPDFFPPSEGWESFDAAVQATHDAGGHILLLPTTNAYALGASGWDVARSHTCQTQDGQYYLWTGQFLNNQGDTITQTTAIMDPGDYWHQSLVTMTTTLARHGIDMIQMDGNPYMPRVCHEADHGHPRGGGNWWFERYRRILLAIRTEGRKYNSNLAIGAEWYAETYIPYLDSAQDQVNTGVDPTSSAGDSVFDGEKVWYIPLWQAVYHDYLPLYSMFASIDGRDASYYRRGLGLALVWGEIPMAYMDPQGTFYAWEIEQYDPQMTEYLRRIVQARETYAYEFLVEGRMLRPPTIEAPDFLIEGATFIPYTLDDVPAFRAPSVLSSAWQSPDGDVGFVFTNISHDPVSFELAIEPGPPELPPEGPYVVYQFRNGSYSLTDTLASLPVTVAVNTQPLDVVVVGMATSEPMLTHTPTHAATATVTQPPSETPRPTATRTGMERAKPTGSVFSLELVLLAVAAFGIFVLRLARRR